MIILLLGLANLSARFFRAYALFLYLLGISLMESALVDVLVRAVRAVDLIFWGSEWCQVDGQRVLRVYVESSTGGVTLDACARANKQINALLLVESDLSMTYNLEVSSPGVNRRLFVVDHYQQYLGADIKFKLQKPQDGIKNLQGKLVAVHAEVIEVDINGVGKLAIAIDNIDKAYLL